MANSTFPVNMGTRNGYGRALLDLLREGRSHSLIPAIPFWWDSGILAVAPLSDEYQLTLDGTTATASTLNTILSGVGEFPANMRILAAEFELIEVFAGGSVSACTAEAGDAGDPNGYITALDVFTGVTVGLLADAFGAEIDNENARLETALEPSITLRSTGGNTDTLTTGKLRYRILAVHTAALGT